MTRSSAENQQTETTRLTEDEQFDMRAKYRRLRLRHDDHFYGPTKDAKCGCDVCEIARDVLRCLDDLAALRELVAQAKAADRRWELEQARAERAEAGEWTLRQQVVRAEAALRATYPATPVDYLISELRDSFFPVLSRTSVLTLDQFDKRVKLFKDEVAGDGSGA